MNEVSDIVLFFGRFHPLVVHLPIGFLFFAFILEVFARWKGNKAVTAAVPLALLLGALSALVACILGYMLSLSGDYQGEALDTHFWFGVATTGVAFFAWLISSKKLKIEKLQQGKPYMATLALIVILLSVTGHYGGNLTHGSDYLTAYMPFGKDKEEKTLDLASVDEAKIFNHLVFPILDEKCISCHNDAKKKGQLSFANPEALQQGGKSGPALLAGNSAASEMIRRVLLDPHDEKFMPPEGKTPMTKEEIAIITYWIDNGKADFQAKVNAVETPEAIHHTAAVMLGLDADGQSNTKLANVAPIANQDISALIKGGFKVRELVAASNLFEVVLPIGTIKKENTEALKAKLALLAPLRKNIIRLSLGGNQLTDSDLAILEGFDNLQLLKLERNPISDQGITKMTALKSLTSLNLFSTQITKATLDRLDKFPKLKNVHVWNTSITKDDASSFMASAKLPISINL